MEEFYDFEPELSWGRALAHYMLGSGHAIEVPIREIHPPKSFRDIDGALPALSKVAMQNLFGRPVEIRHTGYFDTNGPVGGAEFDFDGTYDPRTETLSGTIGLSKGYDDWDFNPTWSEDEATGGKKPNGKRSFIKEASTVIGGAFIPGQKYQIRVPDRYPIEETIPKKELSNIHLKERIQTGE